MLNNHRIISSSTFPTTISISDIELLIRNPYGFYVKKILKLKNNNNLFKSHYLLEFGTFVHNVFNSYNNYYYEISNLSYADKVDNFTNLAEKCLLSYRISDVLKKIWLMKVHVIASQFVSFDITRRKLFPYVYSEIKGKMNLKIVNLDIQVVGVADRIELDDLGRACIIDYKTGSLPTKKDVLLGFYPQLVLHALIGLSNGYNINLTSIESLMYIKIASNTPYIRSFEIEISNKQIEIYKNNLVSLLEYYIINKEFNLDIDFSCNYDYKHLSRSF